MAKIEAFVRDLYIFEPDTVDGRTCGPQAVTLAPNDTLILDFNGATRAEAEARFAKFCKKFGKAKHTTTVECPGPHSVILKQSYESAGRQLRHLHEAGFLTDDDFASAYLRAMRSAVPAPVSTDDDPFLPGYFPEGGIEITRGVF